MISFKLIIKSFRVRNIFVIIITYLGRSEKMRSWVFMISRAQSADETTSAGVQPKCRSIMGP